MPLWFLSFNKQFLTVQQNLSLIKLPDTLIFSKICSESLYFPHLISSVCSGKKKKKKSFFTVTHIPTIFQSQAPNLSHKFLLLPRFTENMHFLFHPTSAIPDLKAFQFFVQKNHIPSPYSQFFSFLLSTNFISEFLLPSFKITPDDLHRLDSCSSSDHTTKHIFYGLIV